MLLLLLLFRRALLTQHRLPPGVLRIKSFSGATAGLVSDELRDFGPGVDTVVIDVRGNAGGLLQGGIETANLFLDKGSRVVTVVSKAGPLTYDTLEEPAYAAPKALYVVVDEKTASAAEVLAAALQENGRAKVIGAGGAEHTFGKGIVQSIIALSDGGGVAVTVARYDTPLGRSINKVGVQVDRDGGAKCEALPAKEVGGCLP